MTAVATPSSAPLFTPPSAQEKRDYAQQLRQQTIACRLRHEKLGVRKALTRAQLKRAAEEFSADSSALTAAKKILDTSDPTYRAVRRVRSQAGAYWKAVSTPFPEPGVRLIRKDAVEAFDARMRELRAELGEAAKALQANYDELKERARAQLGDLFNEDDYPVRVDSEFELSWDFPSIEPPAYLKDLHPHLYEQECERIRGRFEEAVRLTEQAFTQKFHELVAHLAERLKGDVDGKPKTFRDSAIENLGAFFEQFRTLDTGSNAALQALVDQAQQVVQGMTPAELRDNADARAKVAAGLSEIQQAVDALMVDRPERAISLEEDDA